MLFPYRLYNSYKKIGHFVCSKRVGGRTKNTPTCCNELFIRADRPQLNYAFFSYLNFVQQGKKKGKKTKITKFLGPKKNKKRKQKQKIQSLWGSQPAKLVKVKQQWNGSLSLIPFLTQ